MTSTYANVLPMPIVSISSPGITQYHKTKILWRFQNDCATRARLLSISCFELISASWRYTGRCRFCSPYAHFDDWYRRAMHANSLHARIYEYRHVTMHTVIAPLYSALSFMITITIVAFHNFYVFIDISPPIFWLRRHFSRKLGHAYGHAFYLPSFSYDDDI